MFHSAADSGSSVPIMDKVSGSDGEESYIGRWDGEPEDASTLVFSDHTDGNYQQFVFF